MHIKSIDIQNYRGIESLHMDFKEGINLLIGNNGAGKTSLLSALSIMLYEPLYFINNLGRPTKIGDDVYQTTSLIGDTVVSTDFHYPVELKSTVTHKGRDYSFRRIKVGKDATEESKNYNLATVFKDSFGVASQQFPILCFLRAGRNQAKKPTAATVSLASKEAQRSMGYQGAFTGDFNIDEIQKWCIQMDFAGYQKKQEIREYGAFQSIFSKFAAILDEKAKNPKVYFSSSAGSIVYFDGKDEKPLYQLSAGYQAVLCMIIELAYRAVLLNPALEDIAKQTTGVVLIDEIEMHLHPAWQWKIINALKETFPHVQFIIATHSPIILSSAKGATLFLMKSPNEVINLDSVYGFDINEILTLPQGSASRPETVTKYYEEAEDILDNGSSADLDELLIRAQKEFEDNPTVVHDLQSFIEVNRWVEEA